MVVPRRGLEKRMLLLRIKQTVTAGALRRCRCDRRSDWCRGENRASAGGGDSTGRGGVEILLKQQRIGHIDRGIVVEVAQVPRGLAGDQVVSSHQQRISRVYSSIEIRIPRQCV